MKKPKVERGPKVKVRRLEEKLGIHGSPTCELFFDDAPAKLIGERQRGLITYVMSLMNGARIGIASQSLGIAEAAFRLARNYAHSRRQFGGPIENLPAVRELLVNMRTDIQAARALTYHATYCVDVELGMVRKLELDTTLAPEIAKQYKNESRRLKRYNAMLTPMSKYWASEMSMRVSNDSVAVLGGSGYMKDYAAERHLRDSRITTIYEGTSQLQVVAAVRGVMAGTANTLLDELLNRAWPTELTAAVQQIRDGQKSLTQCMDFIKAQNSTDYMDLYGRRLVDNAIFLIVAALFADHATASATKKVVLERWLSVRMPELRMNHEAICSGSRLAINDFAALAGPVPALD